MRRFDNILRSVCVCAAALWVATALVWSAETRRIEEVEEEEVELGEDGEPIVDGETPPTEGEDGEDSGAKPDAQEGDQNRHANHQFQNHRIYGWAARIRFR